jgi:hypothetical protein
MPPEGSTAIANRPYSTAARIPVKFPRHGRCDIRKQDREQPKDQQPIGTGHATAAKADRAGGQVMYELGKTI